MSADLLDQWRQQTDLFSGVHGYLTKSLFLAGSGEPEIVATADVTVGMFELLGVRPYWGRSFAPGDDQQLDLQPVIVAEALARTRFGDPATAVGKRIETTGEPLLVVGVFPATFQFPDGAIRIWRPLDPRGPLTRNFAGVFTIARIAPGASLDSLARTIEQRSAEIGAAAGMQGAYLAQPGPLRGTLLPAEQRRLFLTLLGAAACLLLIACANVASLELASAVHRARTYAIQLAVGASKASLARTALLEGAALIGAAVAAAICLAYLASGTLMTVWPPFLTRGSVNPIDVDERTLLFMAGAAAIVWLLSSLPVVVYASRGSLLDSAEARRPRRRGIGTNRTGPPRPDGRRGRACGHAAHRQPRLCAQLSSARRARQGIRHDWRGHHRAFDSAAVVPVACREASPGARRGRAAARPSGCDCGGGGGAAAIHGRQLLGQAARARR